MRNVILLLIIVTALTSCERKYIRGDLKNRREILQSSNWKLTSITANGAPTSLPDCESDNYYVFIPGGSGTYEEGENNCLDTAGTESAPTRTDFTWQMPGDLRYIFIYNYGGDPEKRLDWQILDMKFETLEVRQFLVQDGVDVRLEMTFTAIPK